MWKRIDPNLIFLSVIMVIFAALLIGTTYMFPNEGQLFQVFAGVLTGTMAIFGRGASKSLGVPDGADQNGTVTSKASTVTATTTVSPPDPKL